MAPEAAAPPRPAPYRSLFGLEHVDGYRPQVRLEGLTLTAAGADGVATRWKAVLIVEGVRTTDHREVANDALTWRTLPLPLMGIDRTTWGHEGAELVGLIEKIVRVDNRLEAEGPWYSTEVAQRFAQYVADQALRWVSADLEVRSAEFIEVYADGGVDEYDDWWGPMPDDWWERITDASIMGATVCPFPALPQAVIVPEGMAFPAVAPDNGLPTLALAASAAGYRGDSSPVEVPAQPPAAWFADPHLERLTHVYSPEPGRIVGHIAGWFTPHIGYQEAQYAPRSPSMGGYFATGAGVTCDDGTRPRTGCLTLGTGHADLRLGWRPASDHYDHTGTAIADVAYGEDEHGGWIAGAVRPGTTEAQLRALLSSDVSGDWRPIGADLELVAVLVVNVAGFPIPALAASAGGQQHELIGPAGAQVARLHHGARMRVNVDGEVLALVAAGVLGHDPAAEHVARLTARVQQLERTIRSIAPTARVSARDAALARIAGRK